MITVLTVNREVRDAIAHKLGLEPAVVARVVQLYRELAETLHEDDFEWRAVSHMCCVGFSLHVFVAEGTKITRQVDTSVRSRSQRTSYGFMGRSYETFGEARAVELTAPTQPGDAIIIGMDFAT